MQKVSFENLEVGKIYVTRGGLATVERKDGIVKVPWGYDRVKVIKKRPDPIKNGIVIVETPWGTQCELPGNYPLVQTDETIIRSEFKLLGHYISKDEIPFSEAFARGICSNVPVPKSTSDNIRVTPQKVSSCTVKHKDFIGKLIEYFSTPRKIAEATNYFNCPYQKVRYAIKLIENKGYNFNNYKILTSKHPDDGKLVAEIKKV